MGGNMKKLGVIIIVAILALTLTPNQAKAKLTLKSAPPVVISTFPAPGTTGVDPSLKEIKVTFNKDMKADNSWSWVTISKDTFPKITGTVKFIDKRTCVAPVSLESGKTYGIWFNSDKFKNFKDTSGNTAVPYLLVFQTK